MAEYPAGEITRNGITVPIWVDDDGYWLAELGDRKSGYTTKAGLETAVARYAKRCATKVEVSFVQYRESSQGVAVFREGVATGLHGGTGNVLAEWADGGKGQITYVHDSVFLASLTEAEKAELRQLAAEMHQLREKRDAIFKGRRIDNLKSVVTQALDEADT